jgi:hypothetical protein
VEQSGAQPVATGGKWDALENRSKQADPQPVATHGNRFAAHSKEGVEAGRRKWPVCSAFAASLFRFPASAHHEVAPGSHVLQHGPDFCHVRTGKPGLETSTR